MYSTYSESEVTSTIVYKQNNINALCIQSVGTNYQVELNLVHRIDILQPSIACKPHFSPDTGADATDRRPQPAVRP